MERKKTKWYHSIPFKLALLFLAVTAAVLAVTGLGISRLQSVRSEEENMSNMRHIGQMLAGELEAEGRVFISYQKYMLAHYAEVFIPHDFDMSFVESAEAAFETAFEKEYPGRVFDTEIAFDDMTEELKILFVTYYHAKWFLCFEDMRGYFELPYIYYVLPDAGDHHVIYAFDSERTYEGDEADNRLHLMDDYEEDYEECRCLFDTWTEGQMLDAMDSFDNEYGRTYTYYVPLYINGEKLGLVCVDTNTDFVDASTSAMIKKLGIFSGLVMLLGFAAATAMNIGYAGKISQIIRYVREYSSTKDISAVDELQKKIRGKDEVSALGLHIGDVMRDLDEYMKNFAKTEEKLAESRQTATMDALTGVRNKLAYDSEIQKEDLAVLGGHTDVGLIMIDLNYLKKINDEYGHDKGNIAIKKLCGFICGIFEHSPVFRVGGDEFVVLLKGEDLKHAGKLCLDFETKIKENYADGSLKPWERISAALGMAVYDPERDKELADVFKRADEAMYKKKREMKADRKA